MMSSNAGPADAPDASSRGLLLDSGLWLDAPDAPDRIEERRASGEIDDPEADLLSRFSTQGYAICDLGAEDPRLDRLVAEAADLWRTRPADVAYAFDGPARPMSEADEARERTVRSRLHDLHSHSEAARSLYLEPRLHRLARLVLGDDAVATQSLFFEFGSEQILHRDPVVVPTAHHGHLLAAWIALEDIDADGGALLYVPGSHRLPYFEFAPGEYRFDGRTMSHRVPEALAWDDEQCRRHGLETRAFTARKGQVLLWHAGLRHGGGPVRRQGLTRKSFVVHFTTREHYPRRAITIADRRPAEGGTPIETYRIMETDRLLETGGARGFDSPMRGKKKE